MAGHAEVLPAAYGVHHHDGGHFRAAGHYGPANGPREQSTEDFIMRTERSRARALQQYHQQQQHQQKLYQQQREQYQRQQQHHQPPQTHQQHYQYYQRQAQEPEHHHGRSNHDETSNRWSLQTPAVEPAAINESLPENYPRRLSNASDASAASTSATNMTSATPNSRESFDSRMRSPSWSSQTSFESFYSAQSTAQPGPGRSYPYGWQRPALLKQRRKARPGEQFAALPGEVLELILDELKKLHLAPGSTSCATCWMRDACAVALSARKWLKFARTALYEDVQLVGADSAVQKKKLKGVLGTRIVLLRRTLRANPLLAATVRTLKVPAPPPGVAVDEYQNLVAGLVMACSNLERVVGFYPVYDHSFGRFFHALSTRQRLKEMNWILQPSPFQRQHRIRKPAAEDGFAQHHKGKAQRNLLTPGDLQPQQTLSWMENHSGWRYLTALNIHCAPGATLTPDTLLVDTLACLPALQTLCLSHLPHGAFNDAGLLSLPSLKKLSLVHLPGISSAGLSSFATRATSQTLAELTLVHINIDSLPALARILSNLGALTGLSLVQSYPPTLPQDEVIWLFPYLASSSLTRLHWDIPTMLNQANVADSILAKSIAAGGFPGLRRLRTPADPEGLFQSLCRPQEKVDLPSDRYRHNRQHRPGQQSFGSFGSDGHSRNGSTASSQPSDAGSRRGGGGGFGSMSPPTSPRFPADIDLEPRLNSDLHQARLAAQARLEAARQLPRFFVNVVDEDGHLVDKFGLAGYMGNVGSRITYHLLSDAGGRDEKGGLIDVADLLGDCGEDLAGTAVGAGLAAAMGKAGMTDAPQPSGKKDRDRLMKEQRDKEKEREKEEASTREGCQGRWNTYSGAVIDKKDKERWFHTERGRWRHVTLS